MKRKVLIALFILLARVAFSQSTADSYYSRFIFIIDQLKNQDLYQAMLYMDIFLADYPTDASMYFNRGLTNYLMNDRYATVTDFRKVKELNPKMKKELIRFFTSKEYLVEVLTDSYVDFDLLDPDNNYKPVFGLKDSLQGALRPERTCFDVYYYDLTVKIFPGTKSIEGSNQIYFKTITDTRKIQIDLFDNYTINAIQWQGKELTYQRIYNAVFVNFGEILPAGTNQMITIKYEGKPRIAPSPPWNGGFVWKKKRFSHWVGVACEHLGASSWWPCKDHLTEKPDSMQINVQVPNGYQAISNGNLRETVPVDEKYTNFKWFVSYPINSYCVTFYMGKFVNFNETVSSGNGTCNIDYYVLPHHLKTAKKYYEQTKEIVAVFESLFGDYEYQKDGLAMIEAPYEGMEHQSAIAIGDGYGKEKRRNYENNKYDYLVVHETAHEWWGNTVTMGDMADAWISEGFATYSEHLFMEKKFGYPEYLSACAGTMNQIMNIWPMVGARDVNDNTFFGGDIYNKGAAMLNNLRCIINNDTQFFWLIRSFYQKYKLKIATTDDFIHHVTEVTGNDYTAFFNKFLYSPEPPVLVYEYTLFNQKLKFSYQWVNVEENFTMPFTITLNDTLNYRLVGTTTPRVFKADEVNIFYLPNKFMYDKDRLPQNAFTYYWTSWRR